MEKRFKNWRKPVIKHGKLTKWNWVVQNPQGLKLGKETDIGAFTYINALHGVEIGDRVEIGSHCSIYSVSTIDHKTGKVVLKEDSRVGSHSTIMPGVTIGKGAVVGANAVVTRDVAPYSIVAGVPARPIGSRQG